MNWLATNRRKFHRDRCENRRGDQQMNIFSHEEKKTNALDRKRKEECNKIFLHGATPPPIGGVTIHVRLLAERLAACDGLRVTVADRNPNGAGAGPTVEHQKGFGGLLSVIRQRGIHHFHVSDISPLKKLAILSFLAMAAPGPKVLTIHSGEFPHAIRRRRFSLPLFKFFLRSIDRCVPLNKYQQDLFKSCGMEAAQIIHAKSYIAPPRQAGTSPQPSRPITPIRILLPGYLTKNYGILASMGIINELRRKLPPSQVVVIAYGPTEPEYAQRVRAALRPEDQLLSNLSHKQFLQEVQDSSLLVRNTREDAYGVVLSEAIERGVPCIATAVCERAPGTLLVELDDLEALDCAIHDVISRPDFHRERIAGFKDCQDQFPTYLRAYQELFADQAKQRV